MADADDEEMEDEEDGLDLGSRPASRLSAESAAAGLDTPESRSIPVPVPVPVPVSAPGPFPFPIPLLFPPPPPAEAAVASGRSSMSDERPA